MYGSCCRDAGPTVARMQAETEQNGLIKNNKIQIMNNAVILVFSLAYLSSFVNQERREDYIREREREREAHDHLNKHIRKFIFVLSC
jgi:hypothetical protein